VEVSKGNAKSCDVPSSRPTEEVGKDGLCSAVEVFRDVAHHRHSGSPDLVAKSKIPRCRAF